MGDFDFAAGIIRFCIEAEFGENYRYCIAVSAHSQGL